MGGTAPKESRRALLETVGSRGAALGLSFAAQFLAMRFLGVAGNGQFGAAVTLANGLSVIAAWGLGPVLLNHAIRLGREQRIRLRHNALLIRSVFGIVTGLLGAGLWSGWSAGWVEPLALLMLIAFSAHDNLWQFQACGRTSEAYRLMALQGLFNTAGFCLLAFVPGSPVWLALLIQAGSCLATRLIGHFWLRKHYPGQEADNVQAPGLRDLIHATRWNALAGLIGYAAGFSDILLCRAILGESDAGLFRCAQMLLVAPLALVQASTALAQTRWAALRSSQGMVASARAALAESRRWARLTFLACPLLSLAAWLGLPWLLPAFTASSYLLAVWLFVLPLGVAGMMLQASLQVMEQFPFVLRLNLLSCCLSIGGNLLLMPVFGLWTAIFVNVFVNVVIVLFTTRHLARLAAR
jgi:O-antigen/teichoic acid export membrane protein